MPKGVGTKLIRRCRVLSQEDVDLVRRLYAEHLRSQKERAQLEETLLELMQRRDELIEEATRTSPRVIAQKFGCSITAIHYACRPRSAHIV